MKKIETKKVRLGVLIEQEREDKGITKSFICKEANIEMHQLYAVLRGTTNYTITTLLAILEVMKIEISLES